MSVLAHTPFAGKRHFEDSEGTCPYERHYLGSTPKRVRRGNSPAPYFISEGQNTSSDLQALLSLFSEMDEKVVQDVYLDSNCNLEATIRKLGDLKLTKQEEAVAEAVAAAAVLSAVAASTDSTDQSRCSYESPGGPMKDASSSSPAPPHTAADWVELLVQEMAAAVDLEDARVKAAAVLQRFEQAATMAVRTQNRSGAEAALQQKLAEMAKENMVLKKAVQIQHKQAAEQRQERAADAAELRQFREQLEQGRERVRQLELSNYSLAVHLERATRGDTAATGGFRNPDIF